MAIEDGIKMIMWKNEIAKQNKLRPRAKAQRLAASIGFTLVEMLLVMVIIGVILFAGIRYFEQKTLQMRMDRTTLQMQQILNAALAYYVNNGTWPANLACLQGSGGSSCSTAYLPPVGTFGTNPWGQVYNVTSSAQLFYVYTAITQAASNTTGTARATANVIAGTLPLAYTSNDTSGTPPDASSTCTATGNCQVVASINIPGQNLNNATAINFAGLYHHGGCVPVPTCPVDASGNNLVPQIMVVPVSVSGVNDPSPNNTNVYPISSFTAFATSNMSGSTPDTPTDAQPPACDTASVDTNCYSTNGVPIATGAYWRVCLQVVTEKGNVSQTNTDTGANAWGQFVTLMAVTRCTMSTENPPSSDFTVFSQ